MPNLSETTYHRSNGRDYYIASRPIKENQMAGQIIKKGEGAWLVRIEKRYSDGTRKSFSKSVKGKKSDAQKKLNEMLRESDLGILTDSQKQTVNEYLETWLSTIAKPRLHPRTFGDYSDIIRLYLKDSIGNIKLSDLKAIHIQKTYAQMQGRGLSPRRIRYCHAVLRSALQHAVRVNMLSRNEAQLVQLPKQTRREMDVLSQSEAIAFLDAVKSGRFAEMFSFALATGCRPEEYLAVQWKDIDLDKGTATIRRALITHRKGGGWHFSEPKTKQSRRMIPLPVSITKELKKHRKQQLETRLKLGNYLE